MIHLQTKIENHRLSAFIHGLLSGLGLILIIWGLSSIASPASSSTNIYVGLILFGVLMFVAGGFREAYIWGSFSAQPITQKKTPTKRTQPAVSSKPTSQPHQAETPAQTTPQAQTDLNRETTEQIREYPVEIQTREAVIYEQERQT